MDKITLEQILRDFANQVAESIAKSNAEFDARMKKLEEDNAKSNAEFDARMKKLEETVAKVSKQVEKTNESVKNLRDMYGGLSNNLGRETEQKIFYFLEKDKKIGGIQFDNLKFNEKTKGDIELDVVLGGKDYLGYLEIKRNLREYDIDDYFSKTVPAFDKHFSKTKHKNKKRLYLFSCETIAPEAMKMLKEKDCYLIRPKADSFYITQFKKSTPTPTASK